jgi:hypothetical protein
MAVAVGALVPQAVPLLQVWAVMAVLVLLHLSLELL